nr:MAG TPA_asm: tail component protein [Caudoviricetes sp.]
MPKKISINIMSNKSIQNAVKEVENYAYSLTDKCNEFAKKLAQIGVQTAKMKVAQYDAVYTGELLSSINYEQGAVIKKGATWIVYTGCPWAKFVEFGTGIVGKENPHPDIGIVGWKYDVNNHGEKGWFYFRDGEWHWTKGMPSRPFMYETSIELAEKIAEVAKEVFG